jgi:predicted metal-dependent hydrolase
MPRFFAAPAQPATVTFENQLIEYSLAFRSRRTIGFAVRPDGSVRVTAPAGTSTTWVAQQVLKKAAWILKHQAAFRKRAPLAPARRYEAGETHFFLGQPYELQLQSGSTPSVVLTDEALVVTSATEPTPAQTQAQLLAWYGQQALGQFTESFERIWLRFAEFKLPRPKLFVRQMRTRWGSCTPRTNRIRLSLDLLRASPACIDYVMLHECCHLLVPDHSPAFYSLQARLLPDWEARKQELNALPK